MLTRTLADSRPGTAGGPPATRTLSAAPVALAGLPPAPARADFIPLGDLPGGVFSSQALGVSADGSVVVGIGSSAAGPEGEAFRWTAATGLVGLGDLPGSFSISGARGVSADGSVIVGLGFSDPGIGIEAFVWDAANGLRSLRDVLVAQGDDLAGWRLTDANAISADGTTIVGLGINPSGQREAWVARLGPAGPPTAVPEPSALALAAVGAAGLAARRLRRRK